MRALKYGVVPVAFQCGGIAQFVQTFGESADGFTYRAATADGLLDVLRRAVKTVGNGDIARLSAAAMSRDFSRGASARKHVELYESLLGVVARAA
jgi:glycogen synthase